MEGDDTHGDERVGVGQGEPQAVILQSQPACRTEETEMDRWPGTSTPLCPPPRRVTSGGLPGRSVTPARKQEAAHHEGTNSVLKDMTCCHHTSSAAQETFCFTLVS